MSFPPLAPETRKLFDLPECAQRANNICSMVNFFPEAARMMDAIALSRIVEIGSEAGLNTAALLNYAKARGKQLVTVDPAPVPFPFPFQQEEAFTFYQETSAEFLKRELPAEVIFMDGDHNYETVLADLKTIHERRKKSGIKVLFLHDVGWPWARQDIYYDPARIENPHPFHAENRVSPYADAGAPSLSPGNYMTADHAGGPKNGVLTAVEDFLKREGASWDFQRVPVLYGIGILIALDNLSPAEREKLLPLTQELLSHRELLSILELNRIEQLCQYDSLMQQLNNAGNVWRNDQSYIKSVNEILPKLSAEIQTNQAGIDSLQKSLEKKERRITLLSAEKAKSDELIGKKDQALQAIQHEREWLRSELWFRDQALRRQQLALPAERWRTHRSVFAACCPYRWLHAGKLKRIRRALTDGSVKLLSLDIFDTLLSRECRPELARFAGTAEKWHALFPEISVTSFYHARALAHQLAYQSAAVIEGCREASADGIFRIMAKILALPESAIPQLMQEELEYETAHLHLNKTVWNLILEARRNHIPIVAVSDMYWSARELQKILNALLPEPEALRKIYSSSDYGVSKLSGILFDRVVQEESVAYPAILHVGDHENSDFLVPFVRNGIQAFWLPRPRGYTAICRWMQNHRKINLYQRNILHGVR